MIKKILNNKLFKNFSAYTFSMLLSQIAGMLATIKITRVLGPESYGQYGVYISLVAIFVVVSSLGLRQIVIRHIAREPQLSKHFLMITLFGRLAGLLFSSILLLSYQFCQNKELSIIDALMLISLFSLSIWDSLENIVIGRQKTGMIGWFYLIFNIIWLSFILLLPNDYFSLLFIYALQIVIQILKDIVFSIYSYKNNYYEGIVKQGAIITEIKHVCLESRPYYIMFLFGLIITQLPVLFLDINSNKIEIGYFNASNKLLSPVSLVLNSALLVVFPHFSRLFAENREKFIKQTYTAFTFFFLVCAGTAFVLSLFRKEIVFLLFGKAYAESGAVFAYQIWFLVINGGILSLIGNLFGAINQEKKLSKLVIIAAIIAAPFLWFGSKYGAEKLAITYVVFAMIQLTYCWFVFRSSLKEIKKSFFISLISGLVTTFTISILIPESLSLYLKILIVLILLFVVYLNRSRIKNMVKQNLV
jgi:O-antigen/teichoic acid export membrane protein